MSLNLKITVICIIVISLMLVRGVFFPWKADPPGEEEEKARTWEEGYVFEGTSFSIVGPDGREEWKFESPEVYISKERNQALLKSLGGTFSLSAYEDEEVIVSSNNAVAHLDSRVIEFDGDVSVISSQGTLRLDKVTWYPERSKFIGYGNIRFTGDGLVIEGEEVEADGHLKEVRIHGEPVSIHIKD